MKKTSRDMDMLNGSMGDKILLFALPLAVTGILQQLFNAADIAVVGRFVGKNAMAAVGSNSPIIALIISLFTGISIGANVVIAKFIGQNRKDGVKRAVHTARPGSDNCRSTPDPGIPPPFSGGSPPHRCSFG